MRRLIISGIAIILGVFFGFWLFGSSLEDQLSIDAQPQNMAAYQRSQQNSAGIAYKNSKSEDVFRITHTLGEALGVLLPRVKAGDYDALRAFSLIMRRCITVREKGPTAFDDFLENKAAIDDPLRKAVITKLSIYCQSGGSQYSEAEDLFSKYDGYERQAIVSGDPEAIVMAHVSRASLASIAPQYATKEALRDAFARAELQGSPSSKARIALAKLISLGGEEVLGIDEGALRANAGDLTDLHVAAANLYACQVGRYCGPGSEIQLSACLIQGACQDLAVEDYIRDHQFNQWQLEWVDRYLKYLESSKPL